MSWGDWGLEDEPWRTAAAPYLPHRFSPDPTNPYDDEHYNEDRPRLNQIPQPNDPNTPFLPHPDSPIDYQEYDPTHPATQRPWPRQQQPNALYRGVRIDLDHPQWADHPNVQGMKKILYGEQPQGGLFDVPQGQGNLYPHPHSPEGKELSQHLLDFMEDTGQRQNARSDEFTKTHDTSDPTWMGRHWTTDPEIAQSFANWAGYNPGTSLPHGRSLGAVVSADWDGRGEDVGRSNSGGSWSGEKEITLSPGAQLNVNGLHIRHNKGVTQQPGSGQTPYEDDPWHNVMGTPQIRSASLQRRKLSALDRQILADIQSSHPMFPVEHLDPHKTYDWTDSVQRDGRLMKDMKAKGVQQPVEMETDGHLGILGDGNHRLAAAKLLGMSHLPVKFTKMSTRYLSRGGGVPLHPDIQAHLAANPHQIIDLADQERQESWSQQGRTADLIKHKIPADHNWLDEDSPFKEYDEVPSTPVDYTQHDDSISGDWYHVAPKSLAPGTKLIPGGGQGLHDTAPDQWGSDHPMGNRRNHVWLAPNIDKALFWQSQLGEGARIHHVNPGAKPQPWNMTGSEGFVVPHAHVLQDISDDPNLRTAGTYYHRTQQPISDRSEHAMPHSYFYQADDPHAADYETRAYGDHVYSVDIDDSLMEADPNRRHNPGGSPWFRTDPANVGEMTHIHDPSQPFGVPRRKRTAAAPEYTFHEVVPGKMWKAYHGPRDEHTNPAAKLVVDHHEGQPFVQHVGVQPEHRGNGLAATLWEMAGKPLHVPGAQTDEGKAWADKVGGDNLWWEGNQHLRPADGT